MIKKLAMSDLKVAALAFYLKYYQFYGKIFSNEKNK
jgi:hypothetical protein